MITQEQIQEAIDLYPLSDFVEWYQNKFPTKIYVCIGCLFVAMGMVLTANHRNALIPTVIVCGMLVVAAVLHITAWYSKRSTEKKRAAYLGLTLQEYVNLIS